MKLCCFNRRTRYIIIWTRSNILVSFLSKLFTRSMKEREEGLVFFFACVVVCIALGVDDCLEGVPTRPYISGGTVLLGKS